MHFTSKKIPLLLLGATALVCSRTIFFFINDPEGPNLLVVTVMAFILYGISLAPTFFGPSVKDRKIFLLTILIQMVAAAAFYFFCLR